MKAPATPPPPCWEEGAPDPGPLDEEQIARIAKALAHPARVGILEQFEECRPHSVSEIVRGTTLAQSTVSEHLRILREAEVLATRKDGPRIWYCMDRAVLRAFVRAIEDLAADVVLAQSR